MSALPPGIHPNVRSVDVGTDGVVAIPYFILQGCADGPTIFVSAGEHGIEINGMAAIIEFVRAFNPAELGGRIIAVPILNPPNVKYRHHTKGQTRGKGYRFEMPYNTYTRWPGKPDGDPADRICHAIATELFGNLSCVLNFHSWSWHSASACFPGGNASLKAEAALGEQLGIPFVVRSPGASSYHPDVSCLHGYASHKLGVPGFLIELRNQWTIHAEEKQRGLRAIRNACRFFGLRSDPMETESKKFLITGDEATVAAPHDGLYAPRVPIETCVRKGEILGDLYDVDTGRATEIVSPCDGVVWLAHRVGPQADVVLEDAHAYANTGDLLVLIKLQ